MTTNLAPYRVKLDALQEQDVPQVIDWMNNLEGLPFWTSRRKPMLPADLKDYLIERTRSAFFAVIRRPLDQSIAGFIDASIRDRHGTAEFEVFVSPDRRARGFAVLGVGAFVEHLFSNYPVRKLYCQVYAYNERSARLLRTAGFVEEGRFKAFTWWRDRYWDMIVYVLERSSVEEAMSGAGRLGRMYSWLHR